MTARAPTPRVKFIRFRVTADEFDVIAQAARLDETTLREMLDEHGWSHALAAHAMNPDGWARATVLRAAAARVAKGCGA